MDYAGNSKKAKDVPEKSIEKVIVGEVVIKKKSLGEKIKGVFVEADFKSVGRYVILDVLLPAARNMIVDASTKGIERMFYGERAHQHRTGSRTIYNSSASPMRTDYRHPATRPPAQIGTHYPRPGRNDFILATKEEALLVLQSMNDVLEMYEVVSVGDLNELVGLPSSYTDQKWGWTSLNDTHIRPIREGFLIDLPPVEQI